MPPSLTGPRLAPVSGSVKRIVVFLHGYGADGRDLIEIGRQWHSWLPDTLFLAPNAPEPVPGAPMGRQWFGLTFRDPHERWRGANQAAPALDAFLDAELAASGLSPDKLALVGFSQGTMMALHVGLRRKTPPAAILGYSGMLILEEGKGPDSLKGEVTGAPPVLLVHGGADEVIPADALFMAADVLAAADVPAQWHFSPQLGHGIDAEGLRHGGIFLARALGLPYPQMAGQREV